MSKTIQESARLAFANAVAALDKGTPPAHLKRTPYAVETVGTVTRLNHYGVTVVAVNLSDRFVAVDFHAENTPNGKVSATTKGLVHGVYFPTGKGTVARVNAWQKGGKVFASLTVEGDESTALEYTSGPLAFSF